MKPETRFVTNIRGCRSVQRESSPGDSLRSTGRRLYRHYRGPVLALLLFVLPASFASALSVPTIDARTGLLWLGNAGNGQVVAPSPLLNYWGASVPLNINSRFSVVPELDLFGTQYQLLGTRGIPTEIEYASQVWMLSLLLDPEVRYTLPISKALAWGVSLSPAFIFRIPTVSWSISSADIGAITKYLYAKGRFFYPAVGTFFDWQVLPSIALEVRIRSFFPVFHLWDGEGLPFYDQLMVDGSIGLRFSIGK